MSGRPLGKRLVALALGSAVALTFVPGLSQVAAEAPAATPTTKPAATAADLVKNGAYYLLPGEQDVVDSMKTLAQLRAKMEAETKSREAVEKKIQFAKNAFAQLEQQRRIELEKLAKVQDAFQNNQIVARLQALEAQMGDAMKFKSEQEKQLAKIGDEHRVKYMNAVVDLASKADQIADGYATLTKDKELASKLTAEKARLGPQAAFAAQHTQLKRLRAPIQSDHIKITLEGKVPMVDVTLNGSTVRKMVVDSGASVVCIPADLARAMELVPARADPDVQLQLADGKLVVAKMMKLKSVRVGQFTVENVECAVLPPELVAAEPLLGGSFLNNFTYKLDIGREELHLARIGAADGKDPKKPGTR
jgi:aspartyl protease family protein